MKAISKWLIFLLVVSLFVVACSSGAEDTPAEDTATETEETADTPADSGEETADSGEEAADGVMADGEFNAILLPKFLGILVFDQANEGAMEAANELGTVLRGAPISVPALPSEPLVAM